MKKNRKFEMKIYELLGIKVFRKMAFKICFATFTLFTLTYSKEERKEALFGGVIKIPYEKKKTLKMYKKNSCSLNNYFFFFYLRLKLLM